ncbi:MAG: prevent-host-death family protein [Phenylobacterium sp.]|jgi:prevent-host-death family protein
MSTIIGAYDAKTKLPEILRKVAQGQSFTVTNRGNAVAEIIPTNVSQAHKTQTAIDNLLKMTKPTISDEILDELKSEGRS